MNFLLCSGLLSLVIEVRAFLPSPSSTASLSCCRPRHYGNPLLSPRRPRHEGRSSTRMRAFDEEKDEEEEEREEEELFIGDVVEIKEKDGNTLGLAAYTGDGLLHRLLTRSSEAPNLFFYDEESDSILASPGLIHRVLQDNVTIQQRIVADRLSNPHAEHAEDCFVIDGGLSEGVVVKVIEGSGH
ncbi:unnamed protein product [Phaeothamnion confervicola]